jgi:hypothetical protein
MQREGKEASRMTTKYPLAIVIAVSLMAAGCAKDTTPEQVVALRKAGDLAGARALAVDSLNANSNRMAVWRELAVTDLRLAQACNDQTDDLNVLVEAGLICAGMNNCRTKPAEDWKEIETLVAVKIATSAKPLLSSIQSDNVAESTTEASGEWYGADGSFHSYHVRGTAGSLVNYNRVGTEIERGIALYELSRALPVADDGAVIEGHWVDRELAGIRFESEVSPLLDPLVVNPDPGEEDMARWMSEMEDREQSTEKFVDDHRKTAEQAVRKAVAEAAKDLDSLGYFRAETIFRNGIILPE